jgi:uncharacterized membrane protein YbhN (UPF0104 family)
MASRSTLQTAAGALLGLGLLAALLGRASPGAVGAELAAASGLGIAVVLALHLLALGLRVARWRALLIAGDCLGGAGWRAVAEAAFIGWLANAVLPARVGELARPAVHARGTGTSFAAVLGTLIVERAADVVVLSAGLWLALVAVPAPPGIPAAVVDATRVGAWAAPLAVVALGIASRFVALPLPERIDAVVQRLRRGFAGLHSPGAVATLLGSSLAVWGVEAACVAVTLWAFGLPGGWAASVAVVGCVTIAIGLITTPAGLGVEQGVAVVVLGAWGATEPAALAASFVLTATALFWVALGGAAALATRGVGLREASVPDAE